MRFLLSLGKKTTKNSLVAGIYFLAGYHISRIRVIPKLARSATEHSFNSSRSQRVSSIQRALFHPLRNRTAHSASAVICNNVHILPIHFYGDFITKDRQPKKSIGVEGQLRWYQHRVLDQKRQGPLLYYLVKKSLDFCHLHA
jgi:hypothetical protein